MAMTIIATAGIAAITGGLQLYEGNQNRIAAQKASDQASADQQVLIDQATQQQKAANDQITTTATRNSQRNIQKAASTAGQGRGSTILTSPLGVTTGANTATKTILGQ